MLAREVIAIILSRNLVHIRLQYASFCGTICTIFPNTSHSLCKAGSNKCEMFSAQLGHIRRLTTVVLTRQKGSCTTQQPFGGVEKVPASCSKRFRGSEWSFHSCNSLFRGSEWAFPACGDPFGGSERSFHPCNSPFRGSEWAFSSPNTTQQ